MQSQTTPTDADEPRAQQEAARPPIAPELLEAAAERLQGRWARFRAWANMFFADHGFFRYIYLNLHAVGEKGWRAAQPAPHHFRRLKRRGVRTVVNLRGGRAFGSYPLEIEACRREGLIYREVLLRSRDAPTVATLEEVAALFETLEYPAVFHCKSGADRSGLMSALYLMLVDGLRPSEAKRALSLRYGHFRLGPTGVLDAFMAAYERAEVAAHARGERLDLLTWARRDYDRKALKERFKAQKWAIFLTDRVLHRE